MSNIYYDVRVDIQKDIVIDSGLRFTQGDSKVIYLRIAVMNGGVEFDASNTTPSVNFVKPDGTYVTGTPVKSGNFWIYQILGNELQKAGKVLCDIKFTYESGRISSSKFTFIVEKDTTISDAEASSSYILPMEELLIEMQNYKNQGVSIVEASAVNATEAKQGATDAKNEADRAKNEADRAAAIAGIGIADTTTAGIVKIPTDGSITIDPDGTIHSNGGSTSDLMKKSVYDADSDGVVDNAEHATNADNVGNASTSVLEGLSDNSGSLNYNGNALMLEAAQFANQAKLGEFVVNQKGNVKELALHSNITTKLSNITRRTRRNITSDLANLTTAIAEQNLAKYGYAIGDYFIGPSGYYYHLGDMDTNYGGYANQAVVNTHHCGIVVDTKSTCQWLSEGTVTNYSSSTLHSSLTNTALPNIKSDIATLFGDWESHLIKRTELDNSIGGWGTEWNGLKDCLICAMTEVQVYGSRVFSADGYQTGTGLKSLELFRKYRVNEILSNTAIWLKSLHTGNNACGVATFGRASSYIVTNSYRASGLILFH